MGNPQNHCRHLREHLWRAARRPCQSRKGLGMHPLNLRVFCVQSHQTHSFDPFTETLHISENLIKNL